MCGIQLSVFVEEPCQVCCKWREESFRESASTSHYDNVKRRGPNACEQLTLKVGSNGRRLSLTASVLQMRQELVIQPVQVGRKNNFSLEKTREQIEQNIDGSSLFVCWNGEVYEATNSDRAGDFATSDTQMLTEALEKLKNEGGEEKCLENAIAGMLGDFYNAEYAFLILDSNGTIYYGRDPWGRRSLLRVDCPHCQSFQICSTAPVLLKENSADILENGSSSPTQAWVEISPGYVHTTKINGSSLTSIPISIPIPQMGIVSLQKTPSILQSVAVHDKILPEMWSAAAITLEQLLSDAVYRRIKDHETVAVLFSGGLDSAVIAALAARHFQRELYLYNVSFGPSFEKSADRQAALITFQTLQKQYPEKKIFFQDIVVSWEDICKEESHIRTILQPKTTLMDVNIATALWFACRGNNMEKNESEKEKPRVLLLGMGADELLGGYGRHRKAYDHGGWSELQTELKMDQERFWERNLGRDDRIVADHSREARFPFLDVHVTNFIKNLPLSLICDFSLPPGQGDKKILRLVARQLGIEYASTLVKRAIQFGSRISHLSDTKRFGSRRKAKGTVKVKSVS